MRNLVIVRAGAASLHPGWLAGRQSFDVLISRYDPALAVEEEPGVTVHDSPGGKWRGLHHTIAVHRERVLSYDRVWLPDDDLAVEAPAVDAFFRIMEAFGLDLAQPALTADSPYFHEVTQAHRGFFLRFTNFVEVMMPAFSRGLLAKVWEDFARSDTGWGQDYVWPSLTEFPRVAVVDAVQVRHTRPLQGPGRSGGVGAGGGMREQQALMAAKALTRPRVQQTVSLAGLTVAGGLGSLTDPRAGTFVAAVLDAVRHLAERNILGFANYGRQTLTFFEDFRAHVPEGTLETALKARIPNLDALCAELAAHAKRSQG